MTIKHVIPQLRTTDLAATLRFYTGKLGFALEFNYQDFYAGIRTGYAMVHLKQVDDQDPSIPYVAEGGHLHLYFNTSDVAALAAQFKANDVTLLCDVHETDWNTREIILQDDQGHTLYFGEAL